MLPVERSRKVSGAQASLQLLVAADLFWFQGHFPQLPILPGVAQLDWVMHYATALLAPGKAFSALENIKFQQPVPPGSLLQLELDWDASKSRLSFRYLLLRDGELLNASSGKILLC
ncbi:MULTISPECIES: 3-hydroxyacyl-ACP dehydratase FabZ family protein [Pantoea]|uniref:3-hydroxyacyl-ACP dehydratase FabZ family protein n=1 Tax=Pantoea TaxID=53335 RepID=UPI0006612A94|nr:MULTISPECIES: hydroxymyristoyl-ACP dehydratase [Pantoea]MBS6436927.1 hydroxymyristoyl-ACP dehydratase [Pantoea sp.]MDU2728035.1 hydroxymyristoyl-ACP dehydratase [Pantoea sp.]MDU6078817.1 hydroxymyristoyl-ACP dehydratase [Pantoea sp.]